ncbi:Indoleacetate--lysine synthetase [Gracilariopsis chorda]|uniref:Indoleacetate--lysine synthetase n=1 Tax=Gracilariopsis chorda TaxID=448386 RepID=A0A2V3J523_9FLOR|nr:Indoleacetate--lysine synthetase [Gracilariopsis chorda]|eukprot:PXF49464.1 Indoleacetate--lysine synthetase [Gracilariopsis chorda]
MSRVHANFKEFFYSKGGLYFGASGGSSDNSRLFTITQNSIPSSTAEVRKQNRMLLDLFLNTGALPPDSVAINVFVAGHGTRSLEVLSEVLMDGGATDFPLETQTPDSSISFVAERYGANVITGMNSRVLQFGIYCARNGLKLPNITRVLHGGEQFCDEQLGIFSKVFNSEVKVCGVYGSSEAGVFAVRQPYEKWYSVQEDSMIVEVVDENGNVVDEGSEGRLVLTNTLKRSLPMIRFDTGDLARATPSYHNGFECLGPAPSTISCRFGELLVSAKDVEEGVGSYLVRMLGTCLYQIMSRGNEESDSHVTLAIYSVLPAEETMIEVESECIRRMKVLFSEKSMVTEIDVKWVEDGGLYRIPASHKLRAFVKL